MLYKSSRVIENMWGEKVDHDFKVDNTTLY